MVTPVYDVGLIDVELIKSSLTCKKQKLSEVSIEKRKNLVLSSKTGTRWAYVNEVSYDSNEFFNTLFGH